ncbi:arsenate reductase ArsC [Paraburkholderia sp. SIMBA_030]|uniref:arsenate reductase ArsC n=1 Tax=Paraburkholderia sp. SIMBA_030 TaxID=3085773 RepID=UPI00397C00F2
MNDKVYNVLFLCTGNSARSVLAEAQLNFLGGGRFKAYSAGSHPKPEVNPFTLELLTRMKLPTEGLRTKSWDEFAAPDAPAMDFVFTVCDQAAAEQCPVWPGQPITAHWGVPDPAAVQGSDEDKRRAFKDAAASLRKRIELLKSLPMASLERLALQKEVTAIGKTPL